MAAVPKLFLLLALMGLAIVIVARYPSFVLLFLGQPTARCRDGSLSFSARRCGTCSHHRGVAEFMSI
jgi:hypothetical protein